MTDPILDIDPLANIEAAFFLRAFETEAGLAADAGEAPGLVHLSSGSEFLALALARVMRPGDWMTGSHRSHALALACGADPSSVAGEILGRAGGLSGGLAGTQHLIAPEAGFLMASGIVGGQVPLALGAAMAARFAGADPLAITVFGDGAMGQGAVLEALGLAVSLRLPVLFVCENNGIAQATNIDTAMAGRSISARARGFGLAVETCIKADPVDLHIRVSRLAAFARNEGEPAFLEVMLPRLDGHYRGAAGPAGKATKGEDALACEAAKLAADPELATSLESAQARAAARAKDAFKAARAMPPAKTSILDFEQPHRENL